jgi:hypothetical protein
LQHPPQAIPELDPDPDEPEPPPELDVPELLPDPPELLDPPSGVFVVAWPPHAAPIDVPTAAATRVERRRT